MEQEEIPQSKANKIGTKLGLLLMLVVFPTISYFYLKSGFDWRKDAVADMGNYGKIKPAYAVLADGKRVDLLERKVCVLHCFGEQSDLTDDNKTVLDVQERVFQQFKYADELKAHASLCLVVVSNDGTIDFRSHYQKLPSSDSENWVFTGGIGGWRTVLDNSLDLYCTKNKVETIPAYLALSDSTGTIRRFYDAKDEKELDRLIKHLSILLPK